MHLGSGKKRNFWYLAEGLGGKMQISKQGRHKIGEGRVLTQWGAEMLSVVPRGGSAGCSKEMKFISRKEI